jgi:maleylacetate reductase
VSGFVYEALPMRVRFGVGERHRLRDEVDELGISRVLVLTTPSRGALTEEVTAGLGSAAAGVFDRARMHVPVQTVSDARAVADRLGADGYVAVGGGSTTGLAKAIARESGAPVVVIPTTYSGSEMTPIWGTTADGRKTTGRDRRALPRSVVYDPELTVSLPVSLTVASGFNAIAHAVEGLYAPDASPIPSLMAEEGIRFLVGSLPRIAEGPEGLDARADALRGAWLCGSVLGAVTMSLHHKLCHVLGGTFNLSHAETHTVVLPYVLQFNAQAVPATLAALRRATGFDDPAAGLRALSIRLGAPRSLAELGLASSDLDRAVELAGENSYANPRQASSSDIRDVLERALVGTDL